MDQFAERQLCLDGVEKTDGFMVVVPLRLYS